MKRLLAGSVLVGLSLVAAVITAAAQAPQPPQAYRPGVGDLMTATIQPRHAKIMLAGREANWPLAKYELHQLQEALDRVVQSWPRWKGLPLGGMVEAVEKGPMADVEQAIDAKDSAQFVKAFGQLSEGCNACHQAANVGFVVIKAPDASSFPDQDFKPVRP
ncbi:hypothetical protein [Rhodoplanes sp. Z2-YC6860]|uniref:hypothetical protein n=1 Tax=Rhodoplanes sp. Z2-YC6860 TaxID=674703 RepID=UPI00078C339F|nr:hypothetical protein [Rhodoplanes sp. Z2-YC6860]AMN42050.1 cytochrome family protein [Rhodoplanes sp. Z2-YC6860]